MVRLSKERRKLKPTFSLKRSGKFTNEILKIINPIKYDFGAAININTIM